MPLPWSEPDGWPRPGRWAPLRPGPAGPDRGPLGRRCHPLDELDQGVVDPDRVPRLRAVAAALEHQQVPAGRLGGYLAALHKKWFGVQPEKTTSTVMLMTMPK